MRPRLPLLRAVAGAALLVVPAIRVQAQPPAAVSAAPASTAPSPLTRTVLQTKALTTVPGRDGIIVRAELAVGGTAPRHLHLGEEFVYVLDGTAIFDMAGQEPLALKAGDAFAIPANTPHMARNTGQVPLRLLSTYIVAHGKPLAIPVP